MRSLWARAILRAMHRHPSNLLRTLAIAALAMVVLACGPHRTAAPAPVEDIVLTADVRVLVRRFDGTPRTLVTLEGPGTYPTAPRWSPDGRSVAYAQRRFFTGTAEADWGDDVYVQPLAGGVGRMVRAHRQRGEMVEGMAWTPDGRALLLGLTGVGADGNPFAVASSRIVRLELSSGPSACCSRVRRSRH